MKIDHKFIPRDEGELTIVKAIENGSQILCDILNVDVAIRVERQKGWARSIAYYAGLWNPARRMIKINLRNLYGVSLEKILEVLGHEFRHAVQTAHGVCDDLPNVSLPLYLKYRSCYLNRPIEKDARKYQKAYRDMIVNHEEFRFKEHLSDVVPGESIRLPDHDASIEKLGIPKELVQIFQENDGTLFWFDLRDITGKPKRWTKSVARKVWADHHEQLRKQKFETIYRDVTIDDLVS